MLKLANVTVTALLAASLSITALAEKDGETATPPLPLSAPQPTASDGAPPPHKGYDGEECRAIYGEEDCASFEQQMQNCESNFKQGECAELRQCIDELGYEACLVHLNY